MSAPICVELLTRRDCGLCEKAEAVLSALAGEVPLEVVRVDVDAAGGDLLREFDWRVPVVRDLDGRVLAEGLVTEADVRAALGLPVEARR